MDLLPDAALLVARVHTEGVIGLKVGELLLIDLVHQLQASGLHRVRKLCRALKHTNNHND